MPSSTNSQSEPLLPKKLADEREPISLISNVVIQALAIMRIGYGATCLVAPRFASGMFQLDVPAAYTVLTRLFGGRDLVLGQLLWTAGDKRLPDGGRREIKRALWAGIGSDMLDVGSVLFVLATGTTSRASAAILAGGGVMLIIAGAVGVHGL